MREEYTSDCSQSKVFLVLLYRRWRMVIWTGHVHSLCASRFVAITLVVFLWVASSLDMEASHTELLG